MGTVIVHLLALIVLLSVQISRMEVPSAIEILVELPEPCHPGVLCCAGKREERGDTAKERHRGSGANVTFHCCERECG